MEGKKKQEVKGPPAEAVGKGRAGKEAASVKGQAPEPSYTAKELAGSAGSIFGTREECVLAALRAAGKETCTVLEAKGIISRFLGKEVS